MTFFRNSAYLYIRLWYNRYTSAAFYNLFRNSKCETFTYSKCNSEVELNSGMAFYLCPRIIQTIIRVIYFIVINFKWINDLNWRSNKLLDGWLQKQYFLKRTDQDYFFRCFDKQFFFLAVWPIKSSFSTFGCKNSFFAGQNCLPDIVRKRVRPTSLKQVCLCIQLSNYVQISFTESKKSRCDHKMAKL